MRTCILDGRKIADREMLHSTLADSLGFPGWYGKNLDALYDCLTDFHEDAEIRILSEDILKEHLGNYALLLFKVIRRASEDNPHIWWVIEQAPAENEEIDD